MGNNLGVIIEYWLNPAYSTSPQQIHNLGIYATYTGAKVATCQTKPTGKLSSRDSLVFWQLGDLALANEPRKLVAKFISADGAVPEPGHIKAKWELLGSSNPVIGNGVTLSKLQTAKGKEKEESDDPFADETITSPTNATPARNWVEVETRKKLTGGVYEARPLPA